MEKDSELQMAKGSVCPEHEGKTCGLESASDHSKKLPSEQRENRGVYNRFVRRLNLAKGCPRGLLDL
jgi:hypothetical protein